MSEQVSTGARVVRLKSKPSTDDGTFSDGETDNGFKFVTVEKPWADNKTDISCIPRPGNYHCTFSFSEHFQRNLYHVEVAGRVGVLFHSANVHEELKGCIAPGARVTVFAKDRVREGIPSRDMNGVIASNATLQAFHASMQNPVTGQQDPFWLEITPEAA